MLSFVHIGGLKPSFIANEFDQGLKSYFSFADLKHDRCFFSSGIWPFILIMQALKEILN